MDLDYIFDVLQQQACNFTSLDENKWFFNFHQGNYRILKAEMCSENVADFQFG